jgi:hypothetical protein
MKKCNLGIFKIVCTGVYTLLQDVTKIEIPMYHNFEILLPLPAPRLDKIKMNGTDLIETKYVLLYHHYYIATLNSPE